MLNQRSISGKNGPRLSPPQDLGNRLFVMFTALTAAHPQEFNNPVVFARFFETQSQYPQWQVDLLAVAIFARNLGPEMSRQLFSIGRDFQRLVDDTILSLCGHHSAIKDFQTWITQQPDVANTPREAKLLAFWWPITKFCKLSQLARSRAFAMENDPAAKRYVQGQHDPLTASARQLSERPVEIGNCVAMSGLDGILLSAVAHRLINDPALRSQACTQVLADQITTADLREFRIEYQLTPGHIYYAVQVSTDGPPIFLESTVGDIKHYHQLPARAQSVARGGTSILLAAIVSNQIAAKYNEGKFRKAECLFETLIALCPSPDSYLRLGSFWETRMKRVPLAIDAYSRAVELLDAWSEHHRSYTLERWHYLECLARVLTMSGQPDDLLRAEQLLIESVGTLITNVDSRDNPRVDEHAAELFGRVDLLQHVAADSPSRAGVANNLLAQIEIRADNYAVRVHQNFWYLHEQSMKAKRVEPAVIVELFHWRDRMELLGNRVASTSGYVAATISEMDEGIRDLRQQMTNRLGPTSIAIAIPSPPVH